MLPSDATGSGTVPVQHVQSHPGASLTSPKPSLLTIPAEVRVTILRFVLLVDGVVNPYPHHIDLARRAGYGCLPQVNLLQTCSLIYNEASQILYGENVWAMNITSLVLIDDSDIERNWKTPIFWAS